MITRPTFRSINGNPIFGWTCFSIELISFITFGTLYSFRSVEHKRWQNQKEGIVIDTTASLIE